MINSPASSHTTVRTVRYTAVQWLECSASYLLEMSSYPIDARYSFVNDLVSTQL